MQNTETEENTKTTFGWLMVLSIQVAAFLAAQDYWVAPMSDASLEIEAYNNASTAHNVAMDVCFLFSYVVGLVVWTLLLYCYPGRNGLMGWALTIVNLASIPISLWKLYQDQKRPEPGFWRTLVSVSYVDLLGHLIYSIFVFTYLHNWLPARAQQRLRDFPLINEEQQPLLA